MKYLLVMVCCWLAVDGAVRPLERSEASRRRHQPRDSEDGRLPRDLIPYHYVIDIAPDFYQREPPFPFEGTVTISFECVQQTNVLTVNSVGMVITDVMVDLSPDSETSPPSPNLSNWTLEPAADFLHAYVLNMFEPGAKYVARFTYSGFVNPDSYQSGLYWDSYVSPDDGSTVYILATQNEDIGAREMFPSFDEPDLKATFEITVAYQPSVTALSNMPVIRTEPRPNGWVANVYGVSPIMSTYQVCICIGVLDYVEANWEGIVNYPIRVYARPSIIDQMAWVANASIYIQSWLEGETGIKYLRPKMDHIALPTKGGAMENWGLITYGEQYFALNPETSAASGIQTIGSITAHEVAHQWYGNLITANWWTDIWLNEGFATYYDYLPTLEIGWTGTEPSQLDTQYFMDSDQRNTTNPVRKQIVAVWDSGYAFSGSTYPKGGAMVTFLRGILGQSTFNTGLTQYLNDYSYASPTTDQLWQSLTDQATADGFPVDVKTVMDPWLNQMGFPLVSVDRHVGGTATVTQSMFLHPPNQEINVVSQWNYKWTIPLTVVTASSSASDWDGRPTDWFNINDTELVLTGLPANLDDWVIVNPRQRFFYRVKYDAINHAALVSQLVNDHTVIEHQSRSQFIDDSFTLARATYIEEIAAMETTRYLGSEQSYNPWYSALKYTTLSNKMLSAFIWHDTFTSYMLSLVTPLYNTLGWTYLPDDDMDQQLFRRDIIAAACDYGLSDCLQQAQAEYNVYSLAPSVNSVNPNNLPTVLCTGVEMGSYADWNIVFDQYQARRTSQIREERYAYLIGMSCSTDSDTLDRLLSYIVDGVQIASRDQYRATWYLSMNPLGFDKVWNYFDNSWSTVPSGMSKFTVLRRMTETFATQAELDKLNAFIVKNPPTSQSQWSSYNQMTLTVQQNVEWLNANQDSLRDWLAAQTGPLSSHSIRSRHSVSTVDHWRSMSGPDSVERR